MTEAVAIAVSLAALVAAWRVYGLVRERRMTPRALHGTVNHLVFDSVGGKILASFDEGRATFELTSELRDPMQASGFARYKSGSTISSHRHEVIELLTLTSGEGEVRVSSSGLAANPYLARDPDGWAKLRKGDVLILPPLCDHEARFTRESTATVQFFPSIEKRVLHEGQTELSIYTPHQPRRASPE